MQDKTKRRRIISFIFACSLMGYLGYNHEYHPEYAITMNDLSFGRYRHGRVFIGHQDFLDSLNDLTENDILVLDARDNIDPSMKIISSHQITDKDIRNEILCIILRYEEMYPSEWERSIESMRVEWFVHNFLYFFQYQPSHTVDVDLNNSDEELYQKKLVKVFFKI